MLHGLMSMPYLDVLDLDTVRPLLSGHPRDFEKWPFNRGGRLAEVQYKLDKNGSKHDFIDSI